MQLEEINSIRDIITIRIKRRKNIIIWIWNFLLQQFSWKVLRIQFVLFLLLCITFQELYWWIYIPHIDIFVSQIKILINFYLGLVALLIFIRLVISWIWYYYHMIKNKWQIIWYFWEEKTYYVLLLSWLVQVSISWTAVTSAFHLIWYLNLNIIRQVSRDKYTALFLFLITIGHGFLNILLWFFSIKVKQYRTNFILGPIILILIFIIYLNYLA